MLVSGPGRRGGLGTDFATIPRRASCSRSARAASVSRRLKASLVLLKVRTAVAFPHWKVINRCAGTARSAWIGA